MPSGIYMWPLRTIFNATQPCIEVINMQLLIAIPICYLTNGLREQKSLSARWCHLDVKLNSSDYITWKWIAVSEEIY